MAERMCQKTETSPFKKLRIFKGCGGIDKFAT
jgi:hypothetical protein